LEIALEILPQVLLDGIVLGFMYALIALGYTMVYGVLEFINFAHSEIFVLGAFVGVEVMAAPAERRAAQYAPSRGGAIVGHHGRHGHQRVWKMSSSACMRA